MTKKEKVIGLFEFLMELLDEKETNELKTSANPNTVPESNSLTNKLNVSGSLELMKKISEIDKEKANERSKIRMVNNATRPFIEELQTLKQAAYKNANLDRENEENEDLVNFGVTLVDGRPNVISIPSKLRDNIPLTDDDLKNRKNEIPKQAAKQSVKNKELKKQVVAKNKRNKK